MVGVIGKFIRFYKTFKFNKEINYCSKDWYIKDVKF